MTFVCLGGDFYHCFLCESAHFAGVWEKARILFFEKDAGIRKGGVGRK
jgi:hypothetical protein